MNRLLSCVLTAFVAVSAFALDKNVWTGNGGDFRCSHPVQVTLK